MKNLNMKVARTKKNLTQADLAELVGVTRQTISLIEKGQYNPTIKLCKKICKELEASLDEIFGGEDEE